MSSYFPNFTEFLLNYIQTETEPEPWTELPEQEQFLLPCHVCSRTFLPGPLQKHLKYCENNARKKRNKFDSLKQRVTGTDLAPFHQTQYLKRSLSTSFNDLNYKERPPNRWREKHTFLMETIRAAKGEPDTMITSEGTPKNQRIQAAASILGNERCPSCDRQFGPKAFDRHVEWCKEHKSRIQFSSPATPATSVAKERLDARKNYRVPPLRQSKRLTNKEKYAQLKRTESMTTNSSSLSTTSLSSTSQVTGHVRHKSIGGGEKLEGMGPLRVEKCGDVKVEPPKFEQPKLGPMKANVRSPNKSEPKKKATAKKLNAPSVNKDLSDLTVAHLVLQNKKPNAPTKYEPKSKPDSTVKPNKPEIPVPAIKKPVRKSKVKPKLEPLKKPPTKVDKFMEEFEELCNKYEDKNVATTPLLEKRHSSVHVIEKKPSNDISHIIDYLPSEVVDDPKYIKVLEKYQVLHASSFATPKFRHKITDTKEDYAEINKHLTIDKIQPLDLSASDTTIKSYKSDYSSSTSRGGHNTSNTLTPSKTSSESKRSQDSSRSGHEKLTSRVNQPTKLVTKDLGESLFKKPKSKDRKRSPSPKFPILKTTAKKIQGGKTKHVKPAPKVKKKLKEPTCSLFVSDSKKETPKEEKTVLEKPLIVNVFSNEDIPNVTESESSSLEMVDEPDTYHQEFYRPQPFKRLSDYMLDHVIEIPSVIPEETETSSQSSSKKSSKTYKIGSQRSERNKFKNKPTPSSEPHNTNDRVQRLKNMFQNNLKSTLDIEPPQTEPKKVVPKDLATKQIDATSRYAYPIPQIMPIESSQSVPPIPKNPLDLPIQNKSKSCTQIADPNVFVTVYKSPRYENDVSKELEEKQAQERFQILDIAANEFINDYKKNEEIIGINKENYVAVKRRRLNGSAGTLSEGENPDEFDTFTIYFNSTYGNTNVSVKNSDCSLQSKSGSEVSLGEDSLEILNPVKDKPEDAPEQNDIEEVNEESSSPKLEEKNFCTFLGFLTKSASENEWEDQVPVQELPKPKKRRKPVQKRKPKIKIGCIKNVEPETFIENVSVSEQSEKPQSNDESSNNVEEETSSPSSPKTGPGVTPVEDPIKSKIPTKKDKSKRIRTPNKFKRIGEIFKKVSFQNHPELESPRTDCYPILSDTDDLPNHNKDNPTKINPPKPESTDFSFPKMENFVFNISDSDTSYKTVAGQTPLVTDEEPTKKDECTSGSRPQTATSLVDFRNIEQPDDVYSISETDMSTQIDDLGDKKDWKNFLPLIIENERRKKRVQKCREFFKLPPLADVQIVNSETYQNNPQPFFKQECQNTNSPNYTIDPFKSAERQFMELLGNDEFEFVKSPDLSRPHTTDNTFTTKTEDTVKKPPKSADAAGPGAIFSNPTKTQPRASVIDPPVTFQDSLDCDFELIESIIDSYSEQLDPKNDDLFLNLSSLENNGNQTQRKYSDESSPIDPRLINENDNLFIPDNLSLSDSPPLVQNYENYSTKNRSFGLQKSSSTTKITSKTVKSTPEPVKKPFLKRTKSLSEKSNLDFERVSRHKVNYNNNVKKTTSSTVHAERIKARKNLAPLKLNDSLIKPPHLKNREDVTKYFEESKHNGRSPPIEQMEKSMEEYNNESLEQLKAEELFGINDEMYEEYKKYEEMYMKEKEKKTSNKKHRQKITNYGLQLPNRGEEETKSSVICNDSAYGSLNRKSSRSPESSKSQFDGGSPNNGRPSKFCHECGNKYPVLSAKFCVECGVRRLVL